MTFSIILKILFYYLKDRFISYFIIICYRSKVEDKICKYKTRWVGMCV